VHLHISAGAFPSRLQLTLRQVTVHVAEDLFAHPFIDERVALQSLAAHSAHFGARRRRGRFARQLTNLQLEVQQDLAGVIPGQTADGVPEIGTGFDARWRIQPSQPGDSVVTTRGFSRHNPGIQSSQPGDSVVTTRAIKYSTESKQSVGKRFFWIHCRFCKPQGKAQV